MVLQQERKTKTSAPVALLVYSLPRIRNASLQYLCFHFVVSEAQMLQVGGCVRLDRWELVLQHVNDFRQFWISPSKLPSLDEHMEGKALVTNVCLFTK